MRGPLPAGALGARRAFDVFFDQGDIELMARTLRKPWRGAPCRPRQYRDDSDDGELVGSGVWNFDARAAANSRPDGRGYPRRERTAAFPAGIRSLEDSRNAAGRGNRRVDFGTEKLYRLGLIGTLNESVVIRLENGGVP